MDYGTQIGDTLTHSFFSYGDLQEYSFSFDRSWTEYLWNLQLFPEVSVSLFLATPCLPQVLRIVFLSEGQHSMTRMPPDHLTHLVVQPLLCSLESQLAGSLTVAQDNSQSLEERRCWGGTGRDSNHSDLDFGLSCVMIWFTFYLGLTLEGWWPGIGVPLFSGLKPSLEWTTFPDSERLVRLSGPAALRGGQCPYQTGLRAARRPGTGQMFWEFFIYTRCSSSQSYLDVPRDSKVLISEKCDNLSSWADLKHHGII